MFRSIFLLLPGLLFAKSLPLNIYLQQAAKVDPILAESRYALLLGEIKEEQLKMGAILPKFRLTYGVGAAPAVSESENLEDPSDPVREFDFSQLGPAMGVKLEIVQPLNLSRLNVALRANRADLKQKYWHFRKKEIAKDAELQKIYFGYLYAKEMKILADSTHKELKKLETKIEDLLDEEDESVSQFDLLELKANLYVIEKGMYEAAEGFILAQLGLDFSLALPDTSHFLPQDKSLRKRKEKVPSLAELQKILVEFHPDLKRLEHGLEARKNVLSLAELEMGPEFFIFGDVNYNRSWSADRSSQSKDAFVKDPFNSIGGALGLGVRYNLNLWSSNTKVRKARMEWNLLKRKDVYALEGLMIKLQEKWQRFERNRKSLKSVSNSLRASEALLKGAAMKYDVDPAQGAILIKAFKSNVQMKQVFAKSVYDYNVAFAHILQAVGWTLEDYLSIYSKTTP